MSSALVVCIFSVCRGKKKKKNPLTAWLFAYTRDLRSSPSPRPSSLDHGLPRTMPQLRRPLEVRGTAQIPSPPLSARQVCKGRSRRSEVKEGGPSPGREMIPKEDDLPGRLGRQKLGRCRSGSCPFYTAVHGPPQPGQ